MGRQFALEPDITVELRTRGRDRALAELARRQHAAVARHQLIALGCSRHAIARMISKEQLRVVHRGVYAVGPARLTREGRWMAVVLAAGPAPCSATAPRPRCGSWFRITGSDVEVMTMRRGHSRPGIRIHLAALAADEITIVDGIPVTTAARTLFDLAAVLPRHRLERAMHEAEARRRWDTTGLEVLIDRYPRRRGTRALREILTAQEFGRTITRSELELLFLKFLTDNALPRPQTNHTVATTATPYECDFVWPDARLVVELDGYETHGTRKRFEGDRARDRALTIAGRRVIRVTWCQLRDAPHELARDLWALLGRPPAAIAS